MNPTVEIPEFLNTAHVALEIKILPGVLYAAIRNGEIVADATMSGRPLFKPERVREIAAQLASK